MAVCDGAAFCQLWRSYDAQRPAYWDDLPGHGPSPFGSRGVRGGPKWRNIKASRPPLGDAESGSWASPTSRCAALGMVPGAAAAQMTRRSIHWLHIPKTGTTFGTTVMHYGCPRIPPDAVADDGAPIVSLTDRFPRSNRRFCDAGAFLGNLNGHEPVQYPQHRGKTVTLLREPRSRLLSECAAIDFEFRRAFGQRRAAGVAPRRAVGGHRVRVRGSVYGFPFLREFLYSHGLSHAAIRTLTDVWNAQKAIPLQSCLGIEGIKGCQTKMVLGVPCAAPLRLNATLLNEATRRLLHDFAFVGLTDRWNASVCLFHAKYGGDVYAVEFANSRPGGKRPSLGSGALDASEHLLDDPYDSALYASAMARFDHDMQQQHRRE